MAVSVLKRGEAVVWVPPRHIGERAFASEPRLLVGIAGPRGLVVQPSSLDALPKLRTVRLVFDARDVNLLGAKLPPLSGARLRRALPNALEDRLLQDPQACLFAPGPVVTEGQRAVAVIDRGWFEFVLGAFERRGLRVTRAIPGQLAVPIQPGADSLVCIGDGIALRTGRHEGLGWQASDDARGRMLALEALLAQRNLQRDTPPPDRLVAHVADPAWAEPLRAAAAHAGATIAVEPLGVPGDETIDLLAGREGSGVGRRLADVDWRSWRWPVGWAVAAVVAFLVGLNLHWGRMAAEGDRLRASLESGFRQTFPKVPVVVDPVLQMERELAGLRARAGLSGPADFVPLVARFAQALGPQAAGAMTEAQYRDGRLTVRFVPALVEAASVREQIAQAGRRSGLRVEFGNPGEPVATVSTL